MAYYSTPKISIVESPYSLVYEMKAIIPTKVISLTLGAPDEIQNSEGLTLSLDLLEEKESKI